MLLHTDPLRTDTFTHRGFDTHRLDTQIRLRTDAFSERGLRRTEENRNFTLTIEPHFARKGCAGRKKIAIYLSFLSIEPHFVRKGCCGREKITILLQFFIEPPHFVRKGCISWRLVGTGPRLQREVEKKEREEGKRAREPLQLWAMPRPSTCPHQRLRLHLRNDLSLSI